MTIESRLRDTVEALCSSERNTGNCPQGRHRAADNASAAAVLLEVARILKDDPSDKISR